MKNWLVLGCLLLLLRTSFGQYPAFFSHTIENGGPSNEIYSILQDKQGYIWIGCDAGLYRFNGVRFEHYASSELTSRSVTGLCQSHSGAIYGYNFNGQIIQVKNNQLKVIPHWNKDVNHLAPDKLGRVWISSSQGVYAMEERNYKTTKLKLFQASKNEFSNGIQVDGNGRIFFITAGKLFEKNKAQLIIHDFNPSHQAIPYFLTESNTKPWIFGLVDGLCFMPKGNNYPPADYPELQHLLKGRKLTNAQIIGSDIWISTHTGIIRFNQRTKHAQLYYPKMAFSACMKDREGSYWFTTLHHGLLRIPNLNVLSWNEQMGLDFSDQFSHLTGSEKQLFFATTEGMIGSINPNSRQFEYVNNQVFSDVGAMYFDEKNNCLFFNKMNTVFRYCNNQVHLVNPVARPIKDFKRVEDQYLLATSQGTYLYELPEKGFKELVCLDNEWSRKIIDSPFESGWFLATNHGLKLLMKSKKDTWQIARTVLKNKQITDVTSDGTLVYILTFEGVIFQLDQQGRLKKLVQLDDTYRAVKLTVFSNRLLIATNGGLVLFQLKTKQITTIDRYSGLNSNNVNACVVIDENCWIATGKGLHKIPVSELYKRSVSGKINLRYITVNGKETARSAILHLSHSDVLQVTADGLCYRSNGNFNFAYRFVGDNTGWISVPSSVRELTIPRLPFGKVDLEVKLIDHENRDSANKLVIHLDVKAPFYQRWWFFILVVLGVIGMSYFIFKRRIQQLRARQQLRLNQLKLENELNLTQQNALKAQMNPHFLFNVLNSIKGYIYENDKRNAVKYLSDFSNLVRKVLEMSSKPKVSLHEELEVLELYIQLEGMLLGDDFSYRIHLEEEIDSKGIKLPALLIQPYVENAFKHGLRHLEGSKKLEIRVHFDEVSSLLEICIQDNGIGRHASQEINAKNSNKPDSFATGAMEQRMQLLNQQDEKVSIQIEDVVGSNSNEIQGTRVRIQIEVK